VIATRAPRATRPSVCSIAAGSISTPIAAGSISTPIAAGSISTGSIAAAVIAHAARSAERATATAVISTVAAMLDAPALALTTLARRAITALVRGR
jgi:hypothetical protein